MSKLKVVLGLDECITSTKYTKKEADLHNEYFENFTTLDQYGFNYYVFKRPHLDEFLKYILTKFDCYIFSDSIESYASSIIKKIEQGNGVFKRCIFSNDRRRDTFIGSRREIDLRNISRKFEQIVIIESNVNQIVQKENCIPVKLFSASVDDANDTELLSVIQLLSELENADDVRKVLLTSIHKRPT